jgi:hypothetical protein
MARKLVEYPGAIYPVMNRGDRREVIFRDDEDRGRFFPRWAKRAARPAGEMDRGAAADGSARLCPPPAAPPPKNSKPMKLICHYQEPTPLLTGMDHADGGLNGDWTLNASEAKKVQNTKTFADYISKLEWKVRFAIIKHDYQGETGSFYFSSPAFDLHFITYDGKGEMYYAMGDASITSNASVCDNNGTVSYNANMHLTKYYNFADKGNTPWYTPTLLGYRLQTHGWIKPYHITGDWSQVLTFFF